MLVDETHFDRFKLGNGRKFLEVDLLFHLFKLIWGLGSLPTLLSYLVNFSRWISFAVRYKSGIIGKPLKTELTIEEMISIFFLNV